MLQQICNDAEEERRQRWLRPRMQLDAEAVYWSKQIMPLVLAFLSTNRRYYNTTWDVRKPLRSAFYKAQGTSQIQASV